MTFYTNMYLSNNECKHLIGTLCHASYANNRLHIAKTKKYKGYLLTYKTGKIDRLRVRKRPL